MQNIKYAEYDIIKLVVALFAAIALSNKNANLGRALSIWGIVGSRKLYKNYSIILLVAMAIAILMYVIKRGLI